MRLQMDSRCTRVPTPGARVSRTKLHIGLSPIKASGFSLTLLRAGKTPTAQCHPMKRTKTGSRHSIPQEAVVALTSAIHDLTRALERHNPPISQVDPFIRLPRRGERCPYSGLSRSALANLVVPSRANGLRPPVTANLMKKPGNRRGVWLIPRERLMAYLNALPNS